MNKSINPNRKSKKKKKHSRRDMQSTAAVCGGVCQCQLQTHSQHANSVIQLVRDPRICRYDALGSDYYITPQIQRAGVFLFFSLFFALVVLKIDFRMTQTIYELSAFKAHRLAYLRNTDCHTVVEAWWHGAWSIQIQKGVNIADE